MCLTLPTNCNRQSNLSTWSSYRALVQGTRAKAPAKSSIRWWRYIRVKCDRLEGKAWKDQSHKQTDDPRSITTERWRSNPDLMRLYDKQEYCTAPELMNENTSCGIGKIFLLVSTNIGTIFTAPTESEWWSDFLLAIFLALDGRKFAKSWKIETFLFFEILKSAVLILFFVIVICDSSH